MKRLLLSLLIIATLSAPVLAQEQEECPADGVVRYEASSFVYYNTSFSIFIYKFNGAECGDGYWHFEDNAYFDVYESGNALLEGTAVYDDACDVNDGEVWNVYFRFLASDPFEPKGPIGDPDLSLWDWFQIDTENSYMVHTGTGEILRFGRRGAGAQLGQGANDKTDTFGFSTWFFFYSDQEHGSNSGDINIDLELVECEVECTLDFRTQTPGGWGAEPNGENPGSYLHANFDAAFPDGLVVGCDNTITLTSAQAITDFLPSGGKPAAISESYVDPTRKINTLASHVVALSLSVGFDAYDADFGGSESSLANLIATKGSFAGWTAGQILAEANNVLGGCSSDYSASQLTDALSLINENFVDGNLTGNYLSCDGEAVAETAKFTVYPNPFYGELILEVQDSENQDFEYGVFTIMGDQVATGAGSTDEDGNTSINLSALPADTYILRLVFGEKVGSKYVVKEY